MISGKVGKIDTNSCNSSKCLYKEEIFRRKRTKKFFNQGGLVRLLPSVKQQGSKFENITSFVFSSNKFLFTLGFDLFKGNWLAIGVINVEFVEGNS